MVILAAGTLATSLTRSGPELLAAYHGHVEAIPVTKGVRFERRRHARLFVDRFPDVGAWMRRSTPARLADLHRLKAWPFLSWCFVHRHLVPDVELLLAMTTLVEDPQRCSSKFPTLWRGQRSVPVRVPARILSVRAW
jgi:hypothetical protein